MERLREDVAALAAMDRGSAAGERDSAAWIAEAMKNNVGWWLTSALESNVGLNALAQFVAQYPVEIPQGLGTGALYDDNFQSPLEVRKGNLSLNSREECAIDLKNEDN